MTSLSDLPSTKSKLLSPHYTFLSENSRYFPEDSRSALKDSGKSDLELASARPVGHIYNFRTQKPEAGDYLQVETHLSYAVSSRPAERQTARPSQKKKNGKKHI